MYTKVYLSEYAKEAAKIIRHSSMSQNDKNNFINFFCELFSSNKDFNEISFIDACDSLYEDPPETVNYKNKFNKNSNSELKVLDLLQFSSIRNF